MKYQEASSFSHIARSCWRGMYVDTARGKLVYRHADTKNAKEIVFNITPAELVANDWELVTQVSE